MMCFNYCRSFLGKLAFFTVFLLPLQTDYVTRWYSCFFANDYAACWYSCFFANDSSIEQVYSPLLYVIFSHIFNYLPRIWLYRM